MGSYFPIPNNFKISSSKQLLIKSSITFLNYPSNSLLNNIRNNTGDVFYSVYYIKNKRWKKCKQEVCKFGEYLVLKRDNLNIPFSSFAVAIPTKNPDTPDETDCLPKPISLRNDKSPVEERCSYDFSLGKSTSSYQGEYPERLTIAKKLSFFSFDSLRLDDNPNFRTYLLLINLNQNANDNKTHRVLFYRANNRKIEKEVLIKSNCSKYIYLPKKTKKENHDNGPIFISCSTTTFIPIYISINLTLNSYEISLEHTHPPSELFWGEESAKQAKKIRQNWVI